MMLTELRGDWKHHQQTFRLAGSFASNNICHICLASKVDGRYAFSDFGEQPAWRTTIRTQEQFLRQQLGSPVNSIVYIARFHYSMIRFDCMHCVQLGIGLFANGGCFHELLKIQEWWPGPDQASRFRMAYASFKQFLKESNQWECSQPCFKPYMLVSKSGDEFCYFAAKVSCLKFEY